MSPHFHDEMESGGEESRGVEMTDSSSLLCSNQRDCVGSGQAPGVFKWFESQGQQGDQEGRGTHAHVFLP